jgi:copper homeostasis protein
LKQLVQQAAERITIMPGAGVKSSNIAALKAACGATEFHASARTVLPNPLNFINTAVSDYGNVYVADEEEVRRMVSILAESW